ncbi:TlpA family protein disulfide reductase [Acidimicrobiaceae bacterium]|nr:TlpA family protein disulfide reductase [Acidimicrobiaceae bacterium]|tara:strand:- start:211 stop:702 length:492 start_codon:yes stop_codon:yes gene_type:complete
MLKRNFILIALIVLVGVVSVFFDNETVDEEILPSNQKIDLSNINEVLDTNFQIAEESYVIINLWATWCTPCIEEVGYLQELHDTGNFYVIGLLVDDSESNAEEFILEQNLTYQNVLSQDKIEAFITQFFWSGIPTTLLLDQNFEVLHTFNGPVTYEMILDYVS